MMNPLYGMGKQNANGSAWESKMQTVPIRGNDSDANIHHRSPRVFALSGTSDYDCLQLLHRFRKQID